MKNLKKIANFIAAVSLSSFCILAACSNNNGQIPEDTENKTIAINKDEWKTAIENSVSANSYSYDCAYKVTLADDYFINSTLTGKIDNDNSLAYYEMLDNNSHFPNGDNSGFTFGKFYILDFCKEDEIIYYSRANSDGSYDEWCDMSSSLRSLSFDILTVYSNVIFAETEDGEPLGTLADLFDYFMFDEEYCLYSANLFCVGIKGITDDTTDMSTNIDIKISFKNNKIYTLYWQVNEDYAPIYDFTFFDYEETVITLPDELKP